MSTGLILSQSSIGHTYILSERDTLVSLLTTARGHSLANINQTPHGVYIDTTNFTMFEGATYIAGKSSNIVITHNGAVLVTGPSSTPFTILFEQLTGDALSGSGTTTFSEGAANSTIVINSAGRINW